MKLIYIAGPYRGDVETNIANARRVAIAVWRAGYVALCPHLNTAHFEKDAELPEEVYLDGDLEMLSRCDGAVFIPGWSKSQGSLVEHQFCKANKILVLTLQGSTSEKDWPRLLTYFADSES